jgi:hypothetical protein
MLPYEQGDVDQFRMEYHWYWASGTNTTLDQEYVLDLQHWKWYTVDRTTGLRVQCSCCVTDLKGNKYCYGFVNTGYMERLDYGTSFDGQPITCTMAWGEQVMKKEDIFSECRITRAALIAVSKDKDNVVTLTHTINGAYESKTYPMSMYDSDHRYSYNMVDVFSEVGVYHGFKLQASSSDNTLAFEPLSFAVYYQFERNKYKS